jgi:hypothetical protein
MFSFQVLFPKATRGLEPISYRGVLLSTLLHSTVYVFLYKLLNVLVQIANKMELQKKKICTVYYLIPMHIEHCSVNSVFMVKATIQVVSVLQSVFLVRVQKSLYYGVFVSKYGRQFTCSHNKCILRNNPNIIPNQN